MRAGTDFWTALAALASHVGHCATSEQQRRRQIVAAYASFGPLGRQTVLDEMHCVMKELAAIEELINQGAEART